MARFSSIMGLDRVAVVKEGPSAQSLLDFFVQKIETIRQSTGGSAAFHETSSGHLRIQCLPGADPGRGPSAHNVVEIQIMFLGFNTNKRPQGSTAGAATIHHCDVQQIPSRGSTSIFPEVCDPFTNCQEVRAGC